MESGHDYAINGMISAFLGTGSELLDWDWRINFFQNGDDLSFSYLRLVVLAKQCVPSPAKYIVDGFRSVKEISKT